jgi:hypothetical protein
VATIIKPKHSETAFLVPTTANLADGEFCINTTDGKIYQRIGTNIVLVADSSNSIQKRFRAFTDCISATNTDHFSYVVSGTGSAFSSLAVGINNAVGILRMNLGTVATNRLSVASPNFGVMLAGKGRMTFSSKGQFPLLSDITNTFIFRAGFINSITAESTNGIFFRYTNLVNSGKFQAVCRSNGVETAIDTGILAVIATNYLFEIVVNDAGTSVEFKINGAVVGTITTNIPNIATREVGYGVFLLRSAGIISINVLDLDWIDVSQYFSTLR